MPWGVGQDKGVHTMYERSYVIPVILLAAFLGFLIICILGMLPKGWFALKKLALNWR